MSYYQYHVFVCTNRREDGRQCCADCGAQNLRDYLKQQCKQLGLTGPGKVRINSAGCLDRCAEGPVIVVYPQGVWYNYVDKEDLDEIVREHLQGGNIVSRLRLPDEPNG